MPRGNNEHFTPNFVVVFYIKKEYDTILLRYEMLF